MLGDTTNNIPGTLTVGTNGSFTLLVLSSNVLVTTSANGVIGANASATFNEVRRLSDTARWQMGGLLYVGSNGSFNTLIISNSALVRANFAQIGRQSGSGSNLVVVTGSGSTWSNVGSGTPLTVGLSSSGNQMLI